MKRLSTVALILALTQAACVVGGYSSEGGWFLWPGGFVGLLIIVVVLFALVRRRR